MVEWNKNLKDAPKNKAILIREFCGICSGGWRWHKALRMGDQFFNADTKSLIQDPHSWAGVNV